VREVCVSALSATPSALIEFRSADAIGRLGDEGPLEAIRRSRARGTCRLCRRRSNRMDLGATALAERADTQTSTNHQSGNNYDEARHMQRRRTTAITQAREWRSKNRPRPAVRVGVIGLGTGTLRLMRGGRCVPIRYSSAGDPGRPSHLARLESQDRDGCWVTPGFRSNREQPQEYDLLAVDAFSRRPPSRYTTDAGSLRALFQHLKTDGVAGRARIDKHLICTDCADGGGCDGRSHVIE